MRGGGAEIPVLSFPAKVVGFSRGKKGSSNSDLQPFLSLFVKAKAPCEKRLARSWDSKPLNYSPDDAMYLFRPVQYFNMERNVIKKIKSVRTTKKIKRIIEKDRQLISSSYTRGYPLVIDKGLGANIWDIEGNKYIDFTSGIAVANVGHCNPDVAEAVRKQTQKILHNASTDFYNEIEIELAEKLADVTPGNFPKRIFFTNSGTETVECAFKLARWYKKRPRIISFLGAFHGRTFGSMTLSASKLVHRDHFSPLVPGVTHAPYPYCYRCPVGEEGYPQCKYECLKYLEEQILTRVVPPDEVAGIIVEPVQGENGYIVPPRDFHKKLKKMCKKHGFLYIADEIQTGFCRSGKWFASDVFGVQPDIICLAKAIAGGLPMGACVSRRKIMTWPKGSHANTFGGNPVACSASLAAIEFMRKNKLWKNAEKLGRFGLKYLRDLQNEVKLIGDIRGLGLMIGIELVRYKKTKEPAHRETVDALNRAFKKGLLLLSAGTSTVRLAPPLVITKEEFEQGLNILADVLKKVK